MLFPCLVLQGPSAFLQRYVPSPTGKSAEEDYVRAAEMLAGPAFEPYRAWEFSLRRTLDTPSIAPSLPYKLAPPGVDARRFFEDQRLQRQALADEIRKNGAPWHDYLAFCDDEVRHFGAALDLIRSGNGKPWAALGDLKELDSYFVSLTNLGLRAAALKFAAGKPGEATAYLLDQIVLLDNVERSGGSTSANIGGTTAVTTTFAQRLGGLGLADCAAVERTVGAVLARPAALLRFYALREDDWKRTIGSYAKMAVDPQVTVPSTDPVWRATVLRMRAMSPSARSRTIDDAEAIAVKTVSAAAERLGQSEARWIEPRRDETVEPDAPSPASDDEVPAALARMFQFHRAFVARTQAEVRTRLRLLALSAKAQAFWLRNGRYPRTLAEFDPQVKTDPLSGKPFVYRRLVGGFEVSSEGTPETGRIFLDPSIKRDQRGNPLPP